MNIQAFIESLEGEFYKWGTLNAYPRIPLPYIGVLDTVQGMTTPSTMHLLNLAVRQLGEGECYLEVGTWRGSTLIGALLGNDACGIAIDDDSMDEHDGDTLKSWEVCGKNLANFDMTDRVHQIVGSIPAAWEWVDRPAGVYLFDGDKSTEEAAYAGLEGALPFLASEALIFVDDANEINIRRAVYQLGRTYPNNVFTIMDIPTPGNCWPCFWNGIIVMAWRRG